VELVTAHPISPPLIYDLIGKKMSGSVLLHYAVVKERHVEGRVTLAVDYQAAGDIEEELSRIAVSLRSRWKLEDTLLVRRIGRVGTGEIISLAAVSAPASEDAFAACRFAIESFKKMKSVTKTFKDQVQPAPMQEEERRI
jgi:molybdopterin synthase catalytic subunit